MQRRFHILIIRNEQELTRTIALRDDSMFGTGTASPLMSYLPCHDEGLMVLYRQSLIFRLDKRPARDRAILKHRFQM